jgi:hypothetical protein
MMASAIKRSAPRRPIEMLLFVLAVAAVTFIVIDFGAVHFGVDSRDGFSADRRYDLGIEALGPRLR